MGKLRVWSVVVLGALACGACNGGSPAEPTAAAAQPGVRGNGSARATNAPPVLKVKTNPGADPSTQPYPTIRGVAPLKVMFNLCTSEDADQGDSLNWQFNFGDYNSRPVGNPAAGQFNPDADQTCRVEHVYDRPGNYTATLSVTDKHAEDQGRGVSSLARTTTSLSIEVFSNTPPEPGPAAPVILTFTNQGCYSLTWTTSNATSVTILPGSFGPAAASVAIIPGPIGPLSPNGSLFIPFGGPNFTLTATGPGGTATRTSTFLCFPD